VATQRAKLKSQETLRPPLKIECGSAYAFFRICDAGAS
jgi:hypothetical protein